MANLRYKILALLVTLMLFTVGTETKAQSEDDLVPAGIMQDESDIIKQGIESAKTGIVYWQNEAGVNVNESSDNTAVIQAGRWAAELDAQLKIAEKYVVHSKSYFTVKKYLSWAYDALEGLKRLYEATGMKALRVVIAGFERAIEAAETLLKYLE